MTAEARTARKEKPASLETYIEGPAADHGLKVDDALRNLTDTNLRTILNTANEHAFFQTLPDTLSEAAEEYLSATKSRLLVTDIYDLAPKPFDSIVEKAYRLNVVWNSKWPKAPKWKHEERNEWVTPATWYRAFDDLVRTTIIARYIDGPQFIGERLVALARTHELEARLEARALDVGYYAYHFYVVMPVQLLRPDWSVFDDKVSVEVQLTTQLQEAARDLTHGFYAENRVEINPSSNWKWEYRSERFRAAYIAHSLRLIEALIVELREVEVIEGEPERLDQPAPTPPPDQALSASLPEEASPKATSDPADEIASPSSVMNGDRLPGAGRSATAANTTSLSMDSDAQTARATGEDDGNV